VGRNPKTYGTTNLLKHFRCNHKSDYSALQAEEAAQVKEKTSASGTQATLDGYVQQVTPLSFNHPIARKITKSIVEMIALDNQPFSIVDDIGFVRVMNCSS